MADVTVISSSIVHPRIISDSSRGKIHLSPFDLRLIFLGYPQRGLLFPKPNPETSFIARIKSSLSAALDIYFPLASRLVKVNNHEDNTVSFYIDCSDEGLLGVSFVHAIAESVSVSEFLQPYGSVPDFFEGFFPANGVKSIDGISKPLLAIQVTEMKDGIFISFGYNHMVADGASMWNFVQTWSKICSSGSSAGSKNIQSLLLKGWFLDGIDYPIHIPVSEMEMPPLPSRELASVAIVKDIVFHFNKKNISDLKTKANSETTSFSSDLKISSLQAVVAHIWRSFARHSGLNREEESHCRLAADFRQRLNPTLEKDCFGNVANMVTTTATVGDLVDHGLGWAARKISQMVRSLTNEYYRSLAKDMVRDVKVPKFGVGSKMVISDSVTIGSSPWFQVYDNNFGWGKPIAVRGKPGDMVSGKVLLFQGIEEGSIDIHMTLCSHVLVNLLADVEFLENVNIT